MAKRKTVSEGTLSSHWCPPSDLTEGGAGEPVACVASTFEFDAAFFETELLPRFLGLRFDHTEDERTFLVEREERLALTSVAVLVDTHKIDPAQTTLRWDQLPVGVPGSGSIQHSKVVLLVWERAVRLIVASANLTRSGYRRNREVFAALDFWDAPESVPLAPLREALDLLDRVLTWARVPDGTRDRTRDTLRAVRGRLAGWSTARADFRPRDLPRVGLVATCPRLDRDGPRSALDEALERWGPRSASDVTVFTPFAGQPDGAGDKVVERLADAVRTRGCTAWLVVPRVGDESDPTARVPLPRAFGDAWDAAFGSRGGVRVLAVPRYVEGVDRVNREFHSKLFSLEGDARHLLMIGSSNFTPHGMGVGVFNVEANLLFEDAGDGMWDRVELPLDWGETLPVDDVVWDDAYEPGEDTDSGGVTVPRFFTWACYSPVTGVLRIPLDRNSPEPSTWAVRLGTGDRADVPLFDRARASGTTVLEHEFPPTGRPAGLTAVTVEWADSDGHPLRARLLVSVERVEDLVPMDAVRGLGIDALIDCLTRGLSLAEWFGRRSDRTGTGASVPAAQDSLRAVDTTHYALYRARRFGRALHGLCDRLGQTPLIPTAVRYRFFSDPLGPVSLADALARDGGATTGTFPTASDELRLFLAAELLLTVAHAVAAVLRRADARAKKWLRPMARSVVGELAARVRGALAPGVAANMTSYVTEVLGEAASRVGGFPPTEVPDAG